MPSRWVTKTQPAATKQKRVWRTGTSAQPILQKNSTSAAKDVNHDALRTLPFKPCSHTCNDALRTMPFKPGTNGLSDDEDAMSTSAGSSDFGLTESHGPSFAESEETPLEAEVPKQNSSSHQVPRALFLLHRRFVPLSAAPEYSLRTVDAARCGPVDPEILVPPGVFVPPGLEDNFDPTKYRMFAVVATDKEELQGLLQKISLELDRVSTSLTASASGNEPPLQDWIFELPETPKDSDASKGEHERTALPDYMAEYLASLSATPIGKPLKTPQDLDHGMAAVDICNKFVDLREDKECHQVSFEPCAMSKTGSGTEAVANLGFSIDHGAGATAGTASKFMAWPECYKGLSENWPEQVAAPQMSQEWFTPPWGTFRQERDPSCTTGF